MSAAADGFPWLNRRVGWLTPRLPNEVFLNIVSYCDPGTLATLGRCNKDIHSIAIPALYTSIDIRYPRLHKLFYSLAPPRYSCYTFDNVAEASKWHSYKVACCALTKRFRLVGWYEGHTGPLKFVYISPPNMILFSNVITLLLDNSAENVLRDCGILFQPRHLCYKPSNNRPESEGDMRLGPYAKLHRFHHMVENILRHWPLESLTLHGNTPVPISHPPGGVARVLAPHLSGGKLCLRERYTFNGDHPISPLGSVEVISIKCSSPSEVEAKKDTPYQWFHGNASRIELCTRTTAPTDILDHLSFTTIEDAAPCALCGEK